LSIPIAPNKVRLHSTAKNEFFFKSNGNPKYNP
jgi:hypothetical protein